jgi:acetylornithine deacetylase
MLLMPAPPPLLEMISRLIETPSISSVSPHLDMGNRAAIELLAEWLEGLGFRIEIQPLPGHRAKANLIATLGPERDDGLVLAGHTDTVPYDQGRWQHEPFALTEAGGRLYGLGTADMKAFLGLAIEAARPVRAEALRRPLTILATADEESTMDGARALVERGRRLGRYCVIGEPTNLIPVRQHKGIFMEAIRLRGRSGHSSDPSYGNSALEGMQAVMGGLLAWRGELQARHRNPAFQVPVATLNLGHIHGGDNPNRICGECELHMDLRPLPGMEIEALRHALHRRIGAIAEARGLECAFKPLSDGVPALETPADSAIVRMSEALTGRPSTAVAFATEGPYLNRLGTETVILGPGDIAQAHQPDEYLEQARISPTLELLRGLIERICMAPCDPLSTNGH